MPVTRTESLTFETNENLPSQNDVGFVVRQSPPLVSSEPVHGAFCDWLTIFQSHDHLPPCGRGPDGRRGAPLPVINAGRVVSVHQSGEIEFTTDKTIQVDGSFDSKVRLRSDGWKVQLSGNVGRWNRPDNVWGYSTLECVEKANQILALFALPPFSSRVARLDGAWRDVGARITRNDLTNNVFAGSLSDADALCRYFAGQGAGQKAPKAYGPNGVSWGEGSKYWYQKLYNKAREMMAHGEHLSSELLAFVKDNGLLRHEVSLKSRYLGEHGLKSLDAWKPVGGQSMENVIYGRFAELLVRNSVNVQDVNDIPGKLGLYASSYRAGKDVWRDEMISRATRFRIRKQLLQYGVDIREPLNVMSMCARPRMIELRTAFAPDWYWHQQEAQQAAA